MTKGVGRLIEPQTFPQLTPYFLHPDAIRDTDSSEFAYTQQHTAKLMVKTLLVDPYVPIHLYSGILPIKALQLPAWTIQQALKNMSTFPCAFLSTSSLCSLFSKAHNLCSTIPFLVHHFIPSLPPLLRCLEPFSPSFSTHRPLHRNLSDFS